MQSFPWSSVGLLPPQGAGEGFGIDPGAGETDAQQKFNCECNAEVKGEAVTDCSWAGLVWGPQVLPVLGSECWEGWQSSTPLY